MGRTRALLTEKEREWLASDATEAGSRKYQVISEVRNRINDELIEDIETLAEHHPELLEELRNVACSED
jgi:hypothetical protein